MIKIPVIDANDSLTEVVLDGDTYFLRLTWNSEDDYWSWGLESANHESLVQGLKLVPDFPLLRWVRNQYLPPGELMAISPDRRDSISREALPSGEVVIVYVPEEEVATL